MAGNTKLIGFGARIPGKPGVLHLMRWNGKASVTISEESLEKIRDACYNELPQKPQQGARDDLDNFNVQYNESVGRVFVDMDPDTALELANIIGEWIDRAPNSKGAEEQSGSWVHSLGEAVQAHRDYHDRNEPGVE